MPKVELFTESFTGAAGSAPDTAKWTSKLMSSAIIDNVGGDHLRIKPGGAQVAPVLRSTTTATNLRTTPQWTSLNGIAVPMPSDVQIGDLLVAVIVSNGAQTSSSPPYDPVILSASKDSWVQVGLTYKRTSDTGRTSSPQTTYGVFYRFATAADVASKPELRFGNIGMPNTSYNVTATLSLTAIGGASIPRRAIAYSPSTTGTTSITGDDYTVAADDYQFNVCVGSRTSANASTPYINAITGYDMSTFIASGNGSSSHQNHFSICGISSRVAPYCKPQQSSGNVATVPMYFNMFELTFSGCSGLYGSTPTNPTYEARDSSAYIRAYDIANLLPADTLGHKYVSFSIGSAGWLLTRTASGVKLRGVLGSTDLTTVDLDFNDTDHAWLRIRCAGAGGNNGWSWDTAPDNAGSPGAWVSQGSGSLQISTIVGHNDAYPKIQFPNTQGEAYFDNLNVPTGAWVLDTTPPDVPVISSASAIGTSVTVSWNTNADATLYEVFRDGATQGTTAATSFNQTAPEGTFSYTVRARDAASNWSAQSTGSSVTVDATPPNVPVIAMVTATGSSVAVDWNTNFDAVLYEVFRDGASLGTTTAPNFGETAADGSYAYTVRARDAAGNWSVQSAPGFVTVDTVVPEPPPTPVTPPVIEPGTMIVTIVWDAVPDAVNYEVFRRNLVTGPARFGTGDPESIGFTTEPTFTDTTITEPGTYGYSISAADAAGNWSQPSGEITANVTGEDPEPPDEDEEVSGLGRGPMTDAEETIGRDPDAEFRRLS